MFVQNFTPHKSVQSLFIGVDSNGICIVEYMPISANTAYIESLTTIYKYLSLVCLYHPKKKKKK